MRYTNQQFDNRIARTYNDHYVRGEEGTYAFHPDENPQVLHELDHMNELENLVTQRRSQVRNLMTSHGVPVHKLDAYEEALSRNFNPELQKEAGTFLYKTMKKTYGVKGGPALGRILNAIEEL